MSESRKNENIRNPLSNIVGVAGLIGAVLFFSGWIYRWAYFSFFNLDVNALNFPGQSFLIVTIQVFLGNPKTVFKTTLAIFLMMLVALSFLFLKFLVQKLIRGLQFRFSRSSFFWQFFQSLNQSGKAIFMLLNDLTLLLVILLVVFWAARGQGLNDALRDATYKTTTLPVIALISPVMQTALGFPLEDVTDFPSIKGFDIIGDKGLFEDLFLKQVTDTANPNNPRVWHLLLDRSDWMYIFRSFPYQPRKDERPAIVAVQKSGNQVLILSPSVSE